ncbi:MAG: hypothetical protein NVS2B4_22710 [Ramlibacter sp.]
MRAKRDHAAARQFLERAIGLHGVPEKITTDKSVANTAAIQSIRADCGADIEIRQSKYLNNIVEQDHQAIKRIVRPMLGFKSLRSAQAFIAGIETMHMVKKGQMDCREGQAPSAAAKFYSLAFRATRAARLLVPALLLRQNPLDCPFLKCHRRCDECHVDGMFGKHCAAWVSSDEN